MLKQVQHDGLAVDPAPTRPYLLSLNDIVITPNGATPSWPNPPLRARPLERQAYWF
jgi:hypothetical protein